MGIRGGTRQTGVGRMWSASPENQETGSDVSTSHPRNTPQGPPGTGDTHSPMSERT